MPRIDEPIRVFFDASVIFAAIYSKSGHARDLLTLTLRGQIVGVVSQDVLDEVERNLSKKAPEIIALYHQLLALLQLEVIDDPTVAEVTAAEDYVASKDAAIIAAAINAAPDYFVTYDRKHLLDPDEVARRSGLTITVPATVVARLQDSASEES